MALRDVWLSDLPHWLHKTGGYTFGSREGEGDGPVDGQDVDCCGCYKWGETFDCLSQISGSRLESDWQFTPDTYAWELESEKTAADGDSNPSDYQVTWEWKVGPGGTYAWVPVSSDWHTATGITTVTHPGWLENGRQLCHGCPIDAPTFVGTPGQTVVYNCPSRKMLATITAESAAHLSTPVLGDGSYNAYFQINNDGQPDRWRIRVTTNHYVEIDRDSDGNCGIALYAGSSIIATKSRCGGAPWWRVSVDVENGGIFVLNGIPGGGVDGSIGGGNVCVENLGTLSPQFGFETAENFSGRLRIMEVYLYKHDQEKSGCPHTPDCYAYECDWYYQPFDIVSGYVSDFANWLGDVPVVDGQVEFPSSGGTITYTGTKPSTWHLSVSFDMGACDVGTRLTIRVGSWSANIYKAKPNAGHLTLAYSSQVYGERIVPLGGLVLSCGNGMVSAAIGLGQLSGPVNALVYETSSYPTGNVSIEADGPVVLHWFDIYEEEDADQYCPATKFNCTIAFYTWALYDNGTTPDFAAIDTTGEWEVGSSGEISFPTYGSAAITREIGATMSVPFNPALVPGSSYDDWAASIAICVPPVLQRLQFTITCDDAVFRYYSGGACAYNAEWADVAHGTITQGGTLKAIEALSGLTSASIYYDASLGRLHVLGVTADVEISDYVLTIEVEDMDDYFGVGYIGYTKAPDARCIVEPESLDCCVNQPYPITAELTVTGFSDGVNSSNAACLNDVFEFDRAADAQFIVTFAAGAKRVTLLDDFGATVGTIDLEAITVSCDDDGDSVTWTARYWFSFVYVISGVPSEFYVDFVWTVSSPQECPDLVMSSPNVYDGSIDAFAAAGLAGSLDDYVNMSSATATLETM